METIPDRNDMSTEIAQEQMHQKEELLAPTDDEKIGDLSTQTVQEEEKWENIKTPESSGNNKTLPQQTQVRLHLEVLPIGTELIDHALRKAEEEVKRLEGAIAEKTSYLKHLKKRVEMKNNILQQRLQDSENKSVETTTLYKNLCKLNQEKDAALKKITDETRTLKSELAETEETLNTYKRYKNILFKMSPQEWREAQEAEASKAEVRSHRKIQDEQSREPRESAGEQDLGSSPSGELPTARESQLSLVQSNTLLADHRPESDTSKHEEKVYFSDPAQLLELMAELSAQTMSLMQNSIRRDEDMEKLQQAIKTAEKKIKEDEEELVLQITEMKDRIDVENKRAAVLKTKVQLHESLKTEDVDVLLCDLGNKVDKVYRSCEEMPLSFLSTVEKLTCVEHYVTSLIQQIDDIPKERLKELRQLKDSERKTRLRKEKLRLEEERKREMSKKCLQRSRGSAFRKMGKKIMTRSFPVEKKVEVSQQQTNNKDTAEEKFRSTLYTSDTD